MTWKGSYERGYQQGRLQAIQESERIFAVLREEMADLRRDRDDQLRRADACVDLLLQHLGARAITLAGKAEETARVERQVRTTAALTQLGDPTEDLEYGDPRGIYRSAAEASIFPPAPAAQHEDVATAEG